MRSIPRLPDTVNDTVTVSAAITKKGMQAMVKKEHWLTEPEESDYGAAAQYLSLLLAQDRARGVAT